MRSAGQISGHCNTKLRTSYDLTGHIPQWSVLGRARNLYRYTRNKYYTNILKNLPLPMIILQPPLEQNVDAAGLSEMSVNFYQPTQGCYRKTYPP
jgi:hypothetical protein